MKKRYALAFAILLVFFVANVSAKEIRIPRHPDVHNGKIVFSYFGSIWTASEDGSNPRRMTVNAAHDDNPRFSPDGKWIAFSSNRYGNLDVFVIPAEGGEARQLTYNSAADTVVGWSRDSKKVIFISARGEPFPGVTQFFEVPVEGGLEQVMPTDWGYYGTYSPDGSKFVFNRHTPVWWRKHYRGSNAADLWIYDVKAKTYKKILDNDLNDQEKPNNIWPLYANGGMIYFVSDRNIMAKAGTPPTYHSVNNIYKLSENGGTPTQVTHFTDGSLFFPSISSDGKTIVFEENFGLWKLDVASGQSSEVKINITTDDKANNFHVLTINNDADDYDLSPTTMRAAISAHGEVFTIATERGDVTRVTNSYSREDTPKWSPDGKWIAYVSDKTGRQEVWVATPDGTDAKKLSDADSEKLTLTWAPDSKYLLYTTSDHKLNLVSVESGQMRTLATNDAGNIEGVSVSPDSAWVAYNKADHDLRQHVYLVPAAGGESHRLPDEKIFSSFDPRFTADGKKMVFLAGYVQGGSATLRANVAAIYSVSLAKEDADTMSRDVDTEDEARAMADRAPGRGGAAQRNAGPVEVKIDFDGLEHRINQVTRITDDISTFTTSPDSRSYAFVTSPTVDGRPVPTLSVIQADGSQLRRVLQSAPAADEEEAPAAAAMPGGITDLEYSRDGNTIYFMERNGLWAARVAAPAGGAAAAAAAGGAGEGGGARRRVNFTVHVEVDDAAERKQIFEEGWRALKYRFYDAKMNGVDWAHYREVYEALLTDVRDRTELQNVMQQMIGELSASHTAVSGGGGRGEPDAMQTRYPGFEIVPDSSGFYKISYIYKNGPADHDYVKVAVGDYIISVNGSPVHSGENYWKYYNMTAGRKFELQVNSHPQAEGAWTVWITPVNAGANTTLQYQKWVEDRRVMVDKLSNGEVGYLHIRAMNAPSLAQFEKDLADNHFKKALIIDQRFNGGGGIDQELLEILEQQQYQYTRARDSIYITRPQRAYFGPIVVMQNERSFSDAEVFPDGVRQLKLGKTVGVNTNSSVIGTPSYRLIDGSMIRTPATGLWNITGYNLENYGVPADVWVDNDPASYFQGRDMQIEKAVQVLMDELKQNPPKQIPGRQ